MAQTISEQTLNSRRAGITSPTSKTCGSPQSDNEAFFPLPLHHHEAMQNKHVDYGRNYSSKSALARGSQPLSVHMTCHTN